MVNRIYVLGGFIQFANMHSIFRFHDANESKRQFKDIKYLLIKQQIKLSQKINLY